MCRCDVGNKSTHTASMGTTGAAGAGSHNHTHTVVTAGMTQVPAAKRKHSWLKKWLDFEQEKDAKPEPAQHGYDPVREGLKSKMTKTWYETTPEVDELILGYRAYTAKNDRDGLVLVGLYGGDWPTDTMRARCGKEGSHETATRHLATNADCECGIYAYPDRSKVDKDKMWVAEVVMWGWTQIGDVGMRSEYCRIQRLFFFPPDSIPTQFVNITLANARKRYPDVVVEVGTRNSSASRPQNAPGPSWYNNVFPADPYFVQSTRVYHELVEDKVVPGGRELVFQGDGVETHATADLSGIHIQGFRMKVGMLVDKSEIMAMRANGKLTNVWTQPLPVKTAPSMFECVRLATSPDLSTYTYTFLHGEFEYVATFKTPMQLSGVPVNVGDWIGDKEMTDEFNKTAESVQVNTRPGYGYTQRAVRAW